MLLCFCFVHAMNVQAIMSSDLDEVYPQQVIALNHLYWYDVGALFSLNPKYAHEMEMNWGATPGRQGLLYRIMFEPHRWVNDEVESFLTLHSGEYQSFHDHSFAICICCACVTSAYSLLSSAYVRAMQLSFHFSKRTRRRVCWVSHTHAPLPNTNDAADDANVLGLHTASCRITCAEAH